MTKWAIFSLFFCFILAIVFIGKQARAVFTEPVAQPPENNTAGYLDIGATDQAKSGALRLGTTNTSLPFDYQLEVKGEGADITNVVADNNVQVPTSGNTLFVDAANNKVCVGPCLGVAGTRLEVFGTNGMIVNAGSKYGIYGVSGNTEAIYGSSLTSNGIFGSASGSSNSGVSAFSTLGPALQGFSTTQSQVVGETTLKYGIYGTNLNTMGSWAGYFDGLLESKSDVSGAKFISKNNPQSLVPYTYGQIVGEYSYTNMRLKYYDGTYVWGLGGAGDDSLYKIRASDGLQIFSVNVGFSPTDIAFDGEYIWTTVDTEGLNRVLKINRNSGVILHAYDQNENSSSQLIRPRSIVFDGKYFWVLDRQSGTQGRLVKFNSDGDRIDEIILASGSDDSHKIEFVDGKVIYNGTDLVVIGRNSANGNSNEGRLLTVNPSSKEVVIWTSLLGNNPQDILFDNYYYWVTNQDSNSLTRFYLSEPKICSASPSQSCQSDSDCGTGGCFSVPREYKTYAIQSGSGPAKIVFDGNNFWYSTINSGGRTLQRISAADPNPQVAVMSSLSDPLNSVLFDGSYVWVGINGTTIKKLYAGTGFGNTDLSGTLALQQGTTTTQTGSINISGSARVGTTMRADGDLSAPGNLWGALAPGDLFSGTFTDAVWAQTAALTGATTVNKIIESADSSIIAGANSGYIFRSDNNGISWSRTTLSVAGNVVALKRNNNRLYAGIDPIGQSPSLFVSNDNGLTWPSSQNFCVGACANPSSKISATFAAQNGFQYAASWWQTHPSVCYIWRSVDGGVTWGTTPVATISCTADTNITSFAELANGTLLAGLGATYTPHAPGTGDAQIYQSTDNGANWNLLTTLSPVESIYTMIRTSAGSLITGTYSGIFRSTDSGANWSKISPPPAGVSNVRGLVQVANGNIYAGGAGGKIYRSTDDGATWSELTTLAGAPAINTLTQAANGFVFAGTADGRVFQSGLNPLDANSYYCPEGHYIKNITARIDGKTVGMECRPL